TANRNSDSGADKAPIDHAAFLQIDDSSDLQIQNSKESKLKLRKLIRDIDLNKDGKLSAEELKDWIENLIHKYVASEGEKHMPKIDHDDGYATWDEYKEAAGYTKGDTPEPQKSSEKSKIRDKEKFDLADTNNDGKLSHYELGIMMHPNEATQMSKVIVNDFLDTMDRDNDGRIAAKEFMGGDLDEGTMSELDESFKKIDKDGDGLLDSDELKEWLAPEDKNVFQFEVESLITDLDIDKDGFLTEKEIFKRYSQFATSRATLYGRMLKPDDDKVDKKKSLEKDEVKK
ncbi:hypothetical protein QZH41_020047, partial [Actinostola sp. cb2023]